MAAVQFVNVLDFMMVSPLGPKLAEDPSIAITTSQLPLVVGSYTAAASVTGVLASFFLERFDRRTALVVTLFGLSIGTLLGGIAQGLGSLILARVVAGMFGGPATSLAFAIVADAIPNRRRGWAVGIVLGGFSAASVLGVPAGLTLARFGGWRTPFWGVAALIAVAGFAAMRLLQPMRAHLSRANTTNALAALISILKKRDMQLSLAMTAVTMMSVFVVIPNIPALTIYNLGFDANRLDVLYLAGGIASFITARFTGPLVDRLGSTRVAIGGSAIVFCLVLLWFVAESKAVPVLIVSTVFFMAMTARTVAYNTLTSKVPEAHERARFQSMQSSVQHASQAVAAFVSAQLLAEGPDHRLLHVERVGLLSVAMIALMPFMMVMVERAVASRAASSQR